MPCKLCNRNDPRPNGLCMSCMTQLGVIEMPPALRRASPCLKCNGLTFVRVIPREYTVRRLQDWNDPEVAPMTLTQEPQIRERILFAGNEVQTPRIAVDGNHGILEAYTCRTCGFVEWWVPNAKDIPIGPEYMSELVDYTSSAPYR